MLENFLIKVYIGFYFLLINKNRENKKSTKWSIRFILLFLKLLYFIPVIILATIVLNIEIGYMFFLILLIFIAIFIMKKEDNNKTLLLLSLMRKKKKQYFILISILFSIISMILVPLLIALSAMVVYW